MTIYVAQMAITLITGAILQPNRSKIGRRIFFFINAALFICIASVRSYMVGRDTYQFVTVFQTINTGTRGRTLEQGFLILCELVNLISDDYTIFLFITSLLIYIPLFYFLHKNSKDVVFSVYLISVLLVFASLLTTMRQAIALGIILLSVELFLKKDKKILFVFGVIVATLFHTSAIFVLSYLIFGSVKIRRKYIYWIFGMAILFMFFAKPIFRIVASRFSYSVYVGSELNISGFWGAFLQLSVWLVCFVATFGLFLNTRKGTTFLSEEINKRSTHRHHTLGALRQGKLIICKKKAEQLNTNFLLWCASITVVFSFAALTVSMFERARLYFSVFFLVLIPNALDLISNKQLRTAVKVIMGVFLFAFWYIVMKYRPEWYCIVPYTLGIG